MECAAGREHCPPSSPRSSCLRLPVAGVSRAFRIVSQPRRTRLPAEDDELPGRFLGTVDDKIGALACPVGREVDLFIGQPAQPLAAQRLAVALDAPREPQLTV